MGPTLSSQLHLLRSRLRQGDSAWLCAFTAAIFPVIALLLSLPHLGMLLRC